MQAVHEGVEENLAAGTEMAEGFQEVSLVVEKIASISRANGVIADQVSDSTVQMKNQAQSVADSAQILSSMAETLQKLVDRFSLPDNPKSNAYTSHVNPAALNQFADIALIRGKGPSEIQPTPPDCLRQNHIT
jgi:hypothetical protein